MKKMTVIQMLALIATIYAVTLLALGVGWDDPWRRIIVSNATAESLRIKVDGQWTSPTVPPGRDTMLNDRFRRSGAYGIEAFGVTSRRLLFKRDYTGEEAERLNAGKTIHLVVTGD